MRKYQIIYADPPWSYRSGKVQGAARNHYETMKDEELYHLPVQNWGFTFKTVGFVWIKQNKSGKGYFLGLGWWTRSNAEVCLIAVKGKPKRKSASVRQLLFSPVEEHSKKPDEARDKIIELMGDLPRIELFARRETPGWDVWGNEVTSTIVF